MGLSNEEKGEMSGERLIFTPEDSIYLAIEYFPQVISYALLPFNKNLTNGSLNVEPNPSVNGQTEGKNDSQRRYLKCEGGMRVLHLKKWLKLKYDVRDHNDIEILYKHDPLLDDYTMIDLAYIYSWRRVTHSFQYLSSNQNNFENTVYFDSCFERLYYFPIFESMF